MANKPYVGQSLPHDWSAGHVSGKTLFLADQPPLPGELWVEIVSSPIAHGRIARLDVEAARACDGIVGVYTSRDIPGVNKFGPIVADESLLAETHCHFIGEPIALIAGISPDAVRRAKSRIVLEMEPETPILTIEEAIAADSFLGPERVIGRGDVWGALATAPHRLSHSLQIGGQEHLYLETQTALAIPDEWGHLTIYASTQNPTEIQNLAAKVLALGMHQVVCVCKRMGGGFGGKETQAAIPALMAALVAQKTGRPARVAYGHREDMATTGKRHPYRADYDVGFTGDGEILGLQMAFYANGGATYDLSSSILDRTLFHADNAYYLPHARITGRICRTNLPSNTAFRGFGGPQAVAAMENIIEEIAITLRKDALEIRTRNCYGLAGRDRTPYGQLVTPNTLPAVLSQLTQDARYHARAEAVQAFNAVSQTHWKGLSLTLVKFGISFTTKFLNQGNALVNVYIDGTVQVSTGGTEMGQGLNTKIRQLVADALGVLIEAVVIMPTSTEKNNNTPPTAASAGTDLNGAAAVKACRAIRARMAVLAHRLVTGKTVPEADADEAMVFAGGCIYHYDQPQRQVTFPDVAHQAYRERIDLGERAFYATPGLDFDRETGQGSPFYYYTNGGAVAEVAINRFTGELTVERVDILMDIGRSINPAIDRGQITGAFVQGMGWVTSEELRYRPDGSLLSASASHYKIPTICDIPRVFNIAFAEQSTNPGNVGSSKAVGEPPLLLGVSVWTAIKNALSHAQNGRIPRLALPATNEQILNCLVAGENDAL